MQMQNKLRFLMTCCCKITANSSRRSLRSETGNTFRRIPNKLTRAPHGQSEAEPESMHDDRMVAARVVPAADRAGQEPWGKARTPTRRRREKSPPRTSGVS